MDFSKFLQFPGVLVLAGVVLLVIALIISISSGIKKKKAPKNANQPAINENPETAQPIVESHPVMNESNPMDNPMGMPIVDNNINSQSSFIEPDVKPIVENNNPMGMPNIEPVVEEKPVVDIVPPVQPTVESEKKEPLTNPWANATSAYGGANPMDGINLNFNQGPQEPYGEKNFVASETPTINAMPKEEPVVMPTINTEAPKPNDDIETL